MLRGFKFEATSKGPFWLVFLVFACLASTAQAQQWQRLDGKARDIAAGADGTVWVIGANPEPGGYDIYRRNGSSWTKVAGAGERIAVDSRGNAWIVNDTGNVLRFDGAHFAPVNMLARDIGVGTDGSVWVIGTTAEPGGHSIYRSQDNGASWEKVPGAARRIAVDPRGQAWVVNDQNYIFRFDGSRFIQVAGSAIDVGTSGDGDVWIVGSDSSIHRWSGTEWTRRSGGARDVSGGPNGVMWVVNHHDEIYRGQDAAPANVVARRLFTRDGRYEARILSAVKFGPYVHQAVLGGQPPAVEDPLERAFAQVALLATEAHFVSDLGITAEQAIAKVQSDDNTRRAVTTNIGVLVMVAVMLDRSNDPHMIELRRWATNLYRSSRIEIAKALLDEYKLWKTDPCTYDGLPQARCSGYAGSISAPRPSEELLTQNALGKVVGDQQHEVGAGIAVGLGTLGMGAAGAALSSALGQIVSWSTQTIPITTSLFSAFGGTYSSTAGVIGAVGWAGVIAAPVVAAVTAVVVGTVEGFAVVEASRLEPMLKSKLGAAMTENIVIQNALADESARDFFLLAFQNAAAKGFSLPAPIDGEVRYYCQAGFVSRFKLTYGLDGTSTSLSTVDLPVGHEQTFTIPARATNIVFSGEWFDGGSWRPLFTRDMDRPTFIGFTSYGTLFDPRVKDEYPEVSGVIAQPNELTVTNGGGYVAWVRVTYQQGGQTVTRVDESGTTAGWRTVLNIPVDATNIHLQAWSQTGLVWEPWKTIIDRTYPLPPNECIKLFGTTLEPRTNNECH